MTLQAHMTRLPISRRSLGHAFLAACLFFGVNAQLLLKFATLQSSVQPNAPLAYAWILCGLAVYALGTACWVLCLSYLDLSYAYPFTGLTYVLVVAASWLLFDESVSLQRFVGVLAICLGVALIPAGLRRDA
jgi:multidrug transporter EmrE-like cation transporter